ncbi:Mammalian cell entry related domain protein [Gloeocapsa sp. PCC 7428]|uniref:MlaD family protein n=1 Tax=Gloeocapsa sp. PCC 7428 TaxID=1173026 RepID=UPI0002A5FE09|nr:MlaD family protein [Gloeocapsa sp. PCC 7428]AFZ31806.1 Mammalian cell entry related domain protein [Gloeocapsa sp. PCC 7428]
MQRSRSVREGSVGLLLLLGVGLFVGLVLWLRGVTIGRRSYSAIIEFANVGGMQEGGVVRYRGVNVGNIAAIRPGPNGVEVDVEIAPANLIIPRDVQIAANQSGLISEVSIDITPQASLPSNAVSALPLDPNCDRTLIVCNGARLQGEIGISLDQLISATTRFTTAYSDPNFVNTVNEATKNASQAAAGVAQLTRELSSLTRATQQQIGSLSATANSVQRAADEITASTTKTAAQFGATADQIRLTTAQVNRLVNNLDNLVTTNRTTLVRVLENIDQSSEQLRLTVGALSPTVNRFTQGELIQNLEALSANAAQASANLRDISDALNTPTNLIVLQQTLDSARVTFENAQKITSDLDELTGDPAFRENVRRLINGLSGLVSSTDQLQQQIEVAQTLDSVSDTVKNAKLKNPEASAKGEDVAVDSSAIATLQSLEDLLERSSDAAKTAGTQVLPNPQDFDSHESSLELFPQ